MPRRLLIPEIREFLSLILALLLLPSTGIGVVLQGYGVPRAVPVVVSISLATYALVSEVRRRLSIKIRWRA